jgi:ABC-type Fe3+/spermidine/putrescine transport system ATPase subunit
MIRVEGLTLLFKTFQIMDLDIRIEEREFHFLLGPTGSGKTLILESLMGFRKPEKGKIWINGREVQCLPPEEREISYVPQDLALFPHLTVQENILYGVKAKNLDRQTYEKDVRTLTEVMKIEHLLERYPIRLSGGEKKRVALLRALAPKPKLLLLDEPLSGLDPSIKTDLQELLKMLHSVFHPTVLCVTHDFEEAYFLGDGITICINGRVEQVGKKEDIFLRPGSRKVAHFLGLKNLYRGTVVGENKAQQRLILQVNGLQFSLPVASHWKEIQTGNEVDLYIRSDEIMIIREGKPVKDSLSRNIFDGEIIDIIDRGRYHMVYFQTLTGKIFFEISIPNYALRNLNLSKTKKARVALREESMWIMG